MTQLLETNSVTQQEHLDMHALKSAADQACSLMRVLSNTDRLMLLCQLAQQELCVSEIEEKVGIKQPTLSQQLTILRAEGLVNTRRDGKKIYYSMTHGPALAVMQVLHQQFCPIK